MFRILQGATGGALQPLSQAVLLEVFPPDERGRAMGFWGLGIVVAPILGPVLGGWLTENYSWRWVFYINLPVGVASLLMTGCSCSTRPTCGGRRGHRLLGHGYAGGRHRRAAVSCWTRASRRTGSPRSSSPAVGGGGGDAGPLVIHRAPARNPIIDLRVFKVRSYAVGVFLMTVLGLVLYGSLVCCR